jgi:hypothetical protein
VSPLPRPGAVEKDRLFWFPQRWMKVGRQGLAAGIGFDRDREQGAPFSGQALAAAWVDGNANQM